MVYFKVTRIFIMKPLASRLSTVPATNPLLQKYFIHKSYYQFKLLSSNKCFHFKQIIIILLALSKGIDNLKFSDVLIRFLSNFPWNYVYLCIVLTYLERKLIEIFMFQVRKTSLWFIVKVTNN